MFTNSKRGIALLIVLTSVVVITVLAMELNYTAKISLSVSNNYKNELRAYYLAKSSVNIALLRLAIVKKMKTLNIGGQKLPSSLFEIVWSFPFIFPPPKELLAMGTFGGDADLGIKNILEKIDKENNIGKVGYFEHTISGMDSKININMIAVNDSSIQVFKEQMRNHYSSKIEKQESFGHRYPIEDFDVLLNNIIDWIDPDSDSRNGGDEDLPYEKKDPPYKARNSAIPNLMELHMVEGMTDELFNFLSPLLTVFSSGKINVNNAEPMMWKIIDNRLTDEEIALIKEKIKETGPFVDEKELRSWIGQNTTITSSHFNPMQFPLSFEESNYKIEAKGTSGNISKKITCYVSESYSKLLTSGKLDNNNSKVKTVEPEVVYWEIQ